MRLATQIKRTSIVPALCVLATAISTLAGGFYLSLERPGTNDFQNSTDVVLMVKPYGCHQPEEALISAKAEGLVKGRRETIELKLHPASSKGVYGIKRQWPGEGDWLVAVRGTYLGAHTSALLELGPDGAVTIEKAGGKDPRVKHLMRELTASDIDARLQILAKKKLQPVQ